MWEQSLRPTRRFIFVSLRKYYTITNNLKQMINLEINSQRSLVNNYLR